MVLRIFDRKIQLPTGAIMTILDYLGRGRLQNEFTEIYIIDRPR